MAGIFHAHLGARRIRILMLVCERLKNDDCDTCTDNFSLFSGLKYQ